LRTLNLLLLVPLLSSTTGGYDGSMLNGLQALPQWGVYFGSPKGDTLGALASGVTFGWFLCFPVAPYLNDRFGRRNSIAIGAVFMVIGSALQAGSVSYAMFMVSRIVIGFGSFISSVASTLLLSELSYPTHRHIATAAYNTQFYMGALLAAYVTLGTFKWSSTSSWAWRIPSLLQGFFPLCQLLVVWWVPESPRYLMQKDRYVEAKAVLLKHHGGGDEIMGSNLVAFEMAEIEESLRNDQSNTSSYMDFLANSSNRRRLFIVIWLGAVTQLSGNALTSYYLVLVLESIGITSPGHQLVINAGLMTYCLGISLAAACLVEVLGRRTLMLNGTIGMFFAFIIWTVLSGINQARDFLDASLGQGVLAMIFIFYLCYNVGLNGVPILYATEVLPNTLRAKGMNILFLTICLTQIFNGFVNPVAMDAIEWKYYIVYCCVIAVEIPVVYFFFPETKGRTLEEAVAMFDNEPKEVD
jgi:sugar porter (SP) family MFS transporter